MRIITTSLTLQIVCCILLLASSTFAEPKIESSENDKDVEKYDDEEVPKNHRKQLLDEVDLDDVFDTERIRDKQLPILPPIILLDFVNGTDDSNSTVTGDEKSKRTIDGSLGYGFDRNNFFSGSHNFFLPGGKGATSVSIEESISPFEPKTVTEIEKPITEDSDADVAQEEQKSRKTLFEKIPEPLPLQNGREPLPLYPPYSTFGQRTKLHKTSSSEFNRQSQRPQVKYTSSSSTTSGSNVYNKLLSSYTSLKPNTNQASSASYINSANIKGYVRPITSSYVANYMSDVYGGGSNQKPSYNLQTGPASSETPINPQDIASYPRYTIENGVKYEHKIVWKYPDGRVAEMPPTSYVNFHSEHTNPASTNTFRPSQPYQVLPTKTNQAAVPSKTFNSQYANAAQANIYSQRPIQFPADQEPLDNSQQKPSSAGFISSATMNVSPARQNGAASSYNLQNYQYGLRQHPKVNVYRPAINQNTQYNAYSSNYRPASSYSFNSPNSEFFYSSVNQPTENLFMPDGQLSKQVLAKYTPQVQEYLTRVFANGKTASKTEYQNNEFNKYPDYSSLLNYNPSISQYIKNPSSILKAQPTFIQAGDSLIPVIILRVDGAPPVSQQSTSNVNLKSLLRQYLTQYANTVSQATQTSSYTLGSSADNADYKAVVSASQANPVQDLKDLTESLTSLRQRGGGYQDPDFAINFSPDYTQSSQLTQQNTGVGQDYTSTSLNSYRQRFTLEQQAKKPMKVKNVQIVEDPKNSSYKVDN